MIVFIACASAPVLLDTADRASVHITESADDTGVDTGADVDTASDSVEVLDSVTDTGEDVDTAIDTDEEIDTADTTCAHGAGNLQTPEVFPISAVVGEELHASIGPLTGDGAICSAVCDVSILRFYLQDAGGNTFDLPRAGTFTGFYAMMEGLEDGFVPAAAPGTVTCTFETSAGTWTQLVMVQAP